jgi:hypothetical protein
MRNASIRRRDMKNMIYRPEYINPIFRPIFEQLCAEFGDAYQIWTRVENFCHNLSAEIIDPETRATVTISIRKEAWTRIAKLSRAEIRRIYEYLNSDVSETLPS